MNIEQTRSRGVLSPPLPLTLRPLLQALSGIRRGQLTIVLPRGARYVFTGESAGPVATFYVRRPARLLARVMSRGSVGFAEGYMAGDWCAPKLRDLLHLLALNQGEMQPIQRLAGGSVLPRLLDRIQHFTRANSLRGSRNNIAYHYDLGNDFYRLWLDESMTYSGAIFAEVNEPLISAQRRKYQRILDQLGAEPGAHILEIGCGWGGFALEAARQGYRVTGITLSKEQLEYARRRIRRAGLEERVELRLQDYRHLDGQFDAMASNCPSR